MRSLMQNQPLPMRAVSSEYGKISQIAVAFPGYLTDADRYWVNNRFTALFKAFNDRVTFIVMGSFTDDVVRGITDSFASALQIAQLSHEHHLVFCHLPYFEQADNLHPQTQYVQDPFVVLESPFGPVLLEPIVHGNPANSILAEQLAVQAELLVKPSLLRFEGGNILIGDDFALVGKNVQRQNWELASEYEDKDDEGRDLWIRRELANQLGVKYLHWVGLDTPLSDLGSFHSTGSHHLQPCFHLDLFVCLAGKSETGEEVALVAGLSQDNVAGVVSAAEIEKINRIGDSLDKIATSLERMNRAGGGPKFVVIRIPIGGDIVQAKGERQLRLFAYLNAQVEIYMGIKRIYLPSFKGQEMLEDEIDRKLTYGNTGFNRVVWVKNAFEDHALQGGALHCLTKVMQRNTPG